MATRKTIRERLLSQRSIDPITGCWHFTGYLDPSGYGRLNIAVGEGRYVPRLIHRLAYTEFVGPIPEGLDIDHVCHNEDMCHNEDKACDGGPTCTHRRCWNPDHLEPVTNQENSRRGRGTVNGRAAHELVAAARIGCKKAGHVWTKENTLYSNRGVRVCKACRDINNARNNARQIRDEHGKYLGMMA